MAELDGLVDVSRLPVPEGPAPGAPTRDDPPCPGGHECPNYSWSDVVSLLGDARRDALVEAYWKLRDHAESKRSAEVEWRGMVRSEVETRCRGIEDGARDVAELLGIPEHEIERPAE